MKYRSQLSALLIVLAVSVSASDTRFTPATAKGKTDGSSVTIRGTSSLHEWSMEGATIKGTIDVDSQIAQAPSAESWNTSAAAVSVSIPVTSIRSESDRMDRLMQKALKAKAHPNITYQMGSSSFSQRSGEAFTVRTTGKLTIAGTIRDVTMDVAAKPAGEGRYILTGQVPIKMTDYGVKPPTAMMGTIKTGNDVTVILRWVVETAKN